MDDKKLEYWIDKFEETAFYKNHYNKMWLKLKSDWFQDYDFLIPFHGDISIKISVDTSLRNPEDNVFITEKHFGRCTELKEFPLTDEGLSEAIKDLCFKATQTD